MTARPQVRFSDNAQWRDDRAQPREDTSYAPWTGTVAGETPALPLCTKETRRKDIGKQVYASGNSGPFATMHGNISLPLPKKETRDDRGFLPTARAVDFLRSEYVGSRLDQQPLRYFTR